MKRALVAAAVLMLVTTFALADTARWTFDEADAKKASINFHSDPSVQNNHQALDPATSGFGYKFSLGLNEGYERFPVVLLYKPITEAMYGATITVATFGIAETWGTSLRADDVKLQRFTPVEGIDWVASLATRAQRNTNVNGVGQYFANYDTVTKTGLSWAGTTAGLSDRGTAMAPSVETFLGDVIDTQDNFGQGIYPSNPLWDCQTLVQNWVDGIWANQGFALSALDAVRTDAGTATYSEFVTDRWGFSGMIITYTPTTRGDANKDTFVNDDDLSLLLSNWKGGQVGWGKGDFNMSYDVDDDDLSLLLSNWTGGGATVPEPATMGLLLLGGLGLIRRRK